jgi:hypothetical protein
MGIKPISLRWKSGWSALGCFGSVTSLLSCAKGHAMIAKVFKIGMTSAVAFNLVGCAHPQIPVIDVRLKESDRAVQPEIVRVLLERDSTSFGVTKHWCIVSRQGRFVAVDSNRVYPFEFTGGSPQSRLPKAKEYLLMIVGHPPEKGRYTERHLQVVPLGEIIDAEKKR